MIEKVKPMFIRQYDFEYGDMSKSIAILAVLALLRFRQKEKIDYFSTEESASSKEMSIDVKSQAGSFRNL